MKWTNPGHEFDEMAKIITNKSNKYYLWGAGAMGKQFINNFGEELIIKGFIDSNPRKQGTKFCGYPVFSPEQLKKDLDYKVVVTIFDYIAEEKIKKYLQEIGLIERESFFYFNAFLSVFFMYQKNKLVYYYFGLSVTELCTLSCKECSMYIPYLKKPEHYNLNMLKKDVDTLFEYADYIYDFQIFGGEPLIYPKLKDLIEYIGQHYRNKIENLCVVTNATILPIKSLLETFNKYEVTLMLSDYTVSKAFQKTQKINEINQLVKNYSNIRCIIRGEGVWFNFNGDITSDIKITDEEMTKFYNECICSRTMINNGKLFSCNRYAAAIGAGRAVEIENSFIDLNNFSKERKKELMEFELKYTELGYIPYCKMCYSNVPIRQRIIDAAEQMD